MSRLFSHLPLSTGRRLRRRTWASGLALLVVASAVRPSLADDKAAASVPLKQVVLFNSGVGFFGREGKIDGNATVELKFNVEDVNDLLKSMVLQDLGGGKISTVTYGSKDPITRTLRTFAIDLTDNPTLGDLLQQVRGEKVEIQAPDTYAGILVGVEKRQQAAKDDKVVEVEYLNLLTDEGLRSVELATISRIRLLSPELDAEFRQALAVLAMGHATDKKSVKLNFAGEGSRQVRVGYVQEAPIWKTSYRLVIDESGKPFLQGWAIVENTTEEDWQDVNLTLVSGRPISFVMNLYDPLYVPRPVVEPELYASLRPQRYDQDMAAKSASLAEAAPPAPASAAEPQFEALAKSRREGAMYATDGRRQAGDVAAGLGGRGVFQADLSVDSVASASDVGELFQYAIDTPVTLPRQQSAMLPIVNGSVEGQKVSIYNPQVHAKHPLNGLKMKNTTGLHLMQGPVTVFDGGAYAGDAELNDVPADAERLLSYAMDLDAEVSIEFKPKPDHLVSVKLQKGLLLAQQSLERTQIYKVKNSGGAKKTVFIEYPIEPGWKLVAPEKPTEQTRDRYRFAVDVEPGKTTELTVTEQQVVTQTIELVNLDDNTILTLYIGSKEVSPEVKKALQEFVRRRQEISELGTARTRIDEQLAAIQQEQARIRENMEQLQRNTDLYNRYVKKFNEQEDQIEALRKEHQGLTQQIDAKQKELDAYLLGLNIE